MKVNQSTVVRLQLTELERLDPVTVFLEDFGPNRGRITIECFGDAWSSFWPAMGGSLEEFFIHCNDGYLAKNLAPHLKDEIYDFDKLEESLKVAIRFNRREESISESEARDLYEKVSELDYGVSLGHDQIWLAENRDLLYDILGDGFYYEMPMQPNPDYQYLCRIIQAVREGLKKYQH
ncbi:hypothetical protein R7P75_04690 [Vibrio sp. 2175-1]|uniref:hypothetical protein n=1 Tax=Vibrio TaxID=662 RepID=UPI001CDCE9D7|nr:MULTISPECIES: hypothetical protein [Vibrio]MCA2497816.1 hypothetical protein [Vibrio alginolyticus]MDW2217503.1 hypothetical protein [Vibrio sp. 2175-1]